jgi:hypothetical protein
MLQQKFLRRAMIVLVLLLPLLTGCASFSGIYGVGKEPEVAVALLPHKLELKPLVAAPSGNLAINNLAFDPPISQILMRRLSTDKELSLTGADIRIQRAEMIAGSVGRPTRSMPIYAPIGVAVGASILISGIEALGPDKDTYLYTYFEITIDGKPFEAMGLSIEGQRSMDARAKNSINNGLDYLVAQIKSERAPQPAKATD